MTQGHDEVATRLCPRCGGLMKKPAGSPFFWHADGNHPHCDITNIVDTAPLAVQTTVVTNETDETNDEPPPAAPPGGKRRKK